MNEIFIPSRLESGIESWKGLESLGKFWKVRGKRWKAMESDGKFWKVLESGWQAVESLGKFWKVLESFGKCVASDGKRWKVHLGGRQNVVSIADFLRRKAPKRVTSLSMTGFF